METLDYINSNRVEKLREQAILDQKETMQKKFFTDLLSQLLKAIDDITIKKIEDGVTVNNMDEVTASLRNELSRSFKPLIDLTKEIKNKISTLENVEKVEVTNLKDFPTEISINNDINIKNLDDLKKYFQELQETVKSLKLEVSVPQVTVEPANISVQPPEVNVAPTPVIIPPIDFSPLIKELNLSLNKIRTNDKGRPLAVRLSDGQEFINQLERVVEGQRQAMQFMSDVTYVKNDAGLRINPATSEDIQTMAGLVNKPYDYISLGYTGNNITTAVYKSGGSSGTTVATLTLTYSGSNITSVTRT